MWGTFLETHREKNGEVCRNTELTFNRSVVTANVKVDITSLEKKLELEKHSTSHTVMRGMDLRSWYFSVAKLNCRSFETAKIPHTAIARYPVVARWRDDVDFVAAGIFCFQVCLESMFSSQSSALLCHW